MNASNLTHTFPPVTDREEVDVVRLPRNSDRQRHAARGDKQHDIAAYFGVNGGRIAEVATGECDYPSAPAMPAERLPPPGPYVGTKTVFEIKTVLQEAIELISGAGAKSDETEVALEALRAAIGKL